MRPAHDAAATALAAESVGVAQRAMEMAVEYAKDRKQFGTPDRRLPGRLAPLRGDAARDRERALGHVLRRLGARPRAGVRAARGVDGEGLRVRRGLARAGVVDPGARRDRLHLGARPALLAQARHGQRRLSATPAGTARGSRELAGRVDAGAGPATAERGEPERRLRVERVARWGCDVVLRPRRVTSRLVGHADRRRAAFRQRRETPRGMRPPGSRARPASVERVGDQRSARRSSRRLEGRVAKAAGPRSANTSTRSGARAGGARVRASGGKALPAARHGRPARAPKSRREGSPDRMPRAASGAAERRRCDAFSSAIPGAAPSASRPAAPPALVDRDGVLACIRLPTVRARVTTSRYRSRRGRPASGPERGSVRSRHA